MAQIKIDKKSKRVYNMLQRLDVIKYIKENETITQDQWKNLVDAIYYEVYNEKI